MGFGSAFKKAWNAASDAGRKAAAEIAADVNAAKAYAVRTGRAVADAAHDAGVAVKNAAVATGVAVKNTAVKAGLAVKNTAIAAGNAAKDAAIAAKKAVVSTAKKVGKAVTSAGKQAHAVSAAAVNNAYKQVHAVFGRQPVGQPIQPCPEFEREKLDRLSVRGDLIKRGRERAEFMPEPRRSQVRHAATRLEKNNVVVERARLANDVYKNPNNPDPSPPVGWKRVRDDKNLLEKLGLQEDKLKDLLEPPNLGMRAELYQSVFEGQETLVVAFKGTESAEDWKHNALQGAGLESAYYRKATELTKTLRDQLKPGVKLEVTGHSLGGGLASAAALAAGVKATTFNAAGLHPATAKYDLSRAKDLVNAYQVEGELLTTLQDRELNRLAVSAGAAAGSLPATGLLLLDKPVLYGAVGVTHTLPAIDEKDKDGQGYTRAINDINPGAMFNRHAATSVIDGIEQQKADDFNLLQSL